jgi:hypothetical protein
MVIACQTLLSGTPRLYSMKQCRNYGPIIQTSTTLYQTVQVCPLLLVMEGDPPHSWEAQHMVTGSDASCLVVTGVRMSNTWIPDRATTLEKILHCNIILEEDWEKFAGDWDMQLQTVLTAMVILVGGFSGGLRVRSSQN